MLKRLANTSKTLLREIKNGIFVYISNTKRKKFLLLFCNSFSYNFHFFFCNTFFNKDFLLHSLRYRLATLSVGKTICSVATR